MERGESMKIRFTTPCIYETEGAAQEGRSFGCASFGFAGAPDPASENVREWDAQHKKLRGKAYFGTLEEVLAQIPTTAEPESPDPGTGSCMSQAAADGGAAQNSKMPWQAGIVLFGNCGGENEFIRKLYEKTGCPLTGGAAACDLAAGRSGLVAGAGQVAVYMICDPDASISVESKNIHNNILETHKIGFTDPRVFDTIDGEDALEWFTRKRAEYGFGADDFEHMTFSDMGGVNAHTSMNGGRLVSGRDLCPEMLLRYVKKGDVYPQMHTFYDDKDAMIFGCAGLKGILEQDIMTDSMGMFMFGEVATINEVPEFGNLMLSKLVVR